MATTIWKKCNKIDLCPDEHSIASVKYGSCGACNYYMTITDKRIIDISEAGEFISRDEILVDNITRVHGYFSRIRFLRFLLWGILFLLAGVALFVSGASIQGGDVTGFFAAGGVCLGIALIFILIYIFYTRKTFVLIVDCTGVYSHIFSIGIATKQLKRLGGSSGKLKFKLEVDAVDTILAAIGKAIAMKR